LDRADWRHGRDHIGSTVFLVLAFAPVFPDAGQSERGLRADRDGPRSDAECAGRKGIAMAGYLTTHVLDTARGRPAAGLRIELYRLDGAARMAVAEALSNADGRTDAPILPERDFETGLYELVFHAGAYLRATGQAGQTPVFLDTVPIRFGMAEKVHYHVPLLLSPYGYTTYRGS
jgi:5-hydroxyisourate hydrolase